MWGVPYWAFGARWELQWGAGLRELEWRQTPAINQRPAQPSRCVPIGFRQTRHVAALWRFCSTAPATRRAAWERCARPSERAPAQTLRNTAQTAEQAPSSTTTTMRMTNPRLMRGITVIQGAGDGQRGGTMRRTSRENTERLRSPPRRGSQLTADEVMGRSQRPMVVTCTLYPRLMHSLLTNRRPTRAGRTRGEMALTRTALRKRSECAGSPVNNANRVGDVEAALVPHRFSRRCLQAPAVKSFTGQGGMFRSFGRGSQLCYFAVCGRGNEREMS